MSQDQLSVAVLVNQRSRHEKDPRFLRMREEARRMIEEEDRAAEAAKQKEAALTAAVASRPEVREPARNRGVLIETSKQVLGGFADAAKEIVDLAEEASTFVGEKLLDIKRETKGKWSDVIPTTDKVEGSLGYGAVRGVSQFLLPFAAAMKGLSGVYKASKILKPLAVGAAVDFAAFDPHEKRLSNLINEHLPSVSNDITEYLAADKDDTWLEGRLKNALEGGALGLTAEAAFKLVKAYAKHLKTNGRPLPPAEKVEPKVGEASTPKLPAPGKANNGKIAAGAPGDDLGALIRQKIEEFALERNAALQAARAAEETRVTAAFRAAGLDRDKVPIKAVEENVDDVASRGYRTPNSDAGQLGDVDIPTVRTGVNEDGIPRIEVDGVGRGRMPEPWEIDGGIAPRVEPEVDRVLQDFVTGTPRRAWVDPDNGVITMSRERPEGPSVIDMDRRVEDALSRSPVERSAEDLIILRAYKQMQDKALEGFRGRFTVETPSAPKLDDATRREALTPLAMVRDKPKALTDAERIAIREQGEELKAAIAKNAEQMKKVDEKIALLANRGRNQRFTPKGESGYISPSLLMNLGAASVGAVVGAATADDDASFGERLDRAGLFAAGALGVKVAGGKLLGAKRAEKEAAAKETEEVVNSLARPEMAGIRPKPIAERVAAGSPLPTVKRPSFPKAKVTQVADAFLAGDEKSLAAAIDESDFNFANLESSEDIKTVVDAFSNVFEKEINQAKRGVRTLKQQEEFARELGTDLKSLKAQYEAMGFAAERAVAHRAFLMASAQKTRQLAALVNSNPQNLDNVLAFRKQLTAHAEIQAYMKGIQTEAGRLLGSFRIQATSAMFKATEVEFMLQGLGGIAGNQWLASKLLNTADPAKFNAIARKSRLARTFDAIFESTVNGLLSGPRTFVVNVLGNTMIPFVNSGERALAAGIGAVRKTPKNERYQLAEAEILVRSFFEGAFETLKIGSEGRGELAEAASLFAKGKIAEAEAVITNSGDLGTAIKTAFNKRAYADSAAASTAEALGTQTSITAGNFGLRSDTFMGAAVDYLGAITRTPGRMLMSTDEFYKAGHIRAELRAQAYRRAMNENLKGEEFAARVADLLENPTPEMSEIAILAAREGTFTADLGRIGGAVQNLVSVTPGLRYIMPFVRTPINILNYVGERTPGLNAYSRQIREDFAAGGARRDMVYAKSAMGGLLYGIAGYLKMSGFLTGGGEKNQQAERLGAKMPYSIKLGDTWYAYNRLDPLGMFFGLAADIADIAGNVSFKEGDEIAAMAILALNRNLVSKSYLKGLVDTMNVMTEPERYSQAFLNRFVTMVIPFTSMLGTVTTTVDPHIKEVWDAVDAIKSRIPGLSSSLPNHVNLLGEDVKYTDGLGPDFASPIKQMPDKPISPLAEEIGRLNVDLRHPARTLRFIQDAPGIDLTPQQYYRLMKISGAKFKELGEKLVASEAYKKASEVPSEVDPDYIGGKEYMIESAFRAAFQYGRQKLLDEDKTLSEKVKQTQLNKVRVFMGLKPVPIND